MQQAVAALLVLALISSTSAFHVPALCLGRASSSLSCGSQQHAAMFARCAPVSHARPLDVGAMGMSLCEDQEKALVRRGELEEKLMSGAPTEPLQVIAFTADRQLRLAQRSASGSRVSETSRQPGRGQGGARRKKLRCYLNPMPLNP